MQFTLNSALIAEARPVRVIPVLTITHWEQAVPLARALVAGGLTMLEVTLRTPAALDAIQLIAEHVPDAIVGAGTILAPEHAEHAIAAGARFLVSPGSTPALLDAAEQWHVPLLPGAATASEVMALMERGYRFLKFFPAEQSGGIPALNALSGPLADAQFCPTGGITPANLDAYLARPNVVCVGGSWVAPQAHIDAGSWATITRLAHHARTGLTG